MIKTFRRYDPNRSGCILVTQTEAGVRWSVYVGQVCYGCDPIWVTRAGSTLAQVRIIGYTAVSCFQPLKRCGLRVRWHAADMTAAYPIAPHTVIPCTYDLTKSDWREFRVIARKSRACGDGSPLLDWLREYGVDSIPILRQVLSIEPVVSDVRTDDGE